MSRGANPFDSGGVTPDENGVRRYDELQESLIEMLRTSGCLSVFGGRLPANCG